MPKKRKKGQITLFVIIGLVVVLIVGLIIFLNIRSDNKSKLVEGLSIESEESELQSIAASCLEEASNKSLSLVQSQGGYYSIPEDLALEVDFEDTSGFIPYYVMNGKSYIISKDDIQQELSYAISDEFNDCMTAAVPKSNVDTVFPQVKIGNEKVSVFVDKVTIVNNESKLIIDGGSVNINSNLYKYLLVTTEIAKQRVSNKNQLCYTCIDAIAERYGVSVSVIDVNDASRLLFVISDNSIPVFAFAEKVSNEV